MPEEQQIVKINKEELLEKVRSLENNGYRLVQICCTTLDTYQIDYSFDKDYNFVNLRLNLPLENAAIPSISDIYWTSFTYENEIRDLFGVIVNGINIDFNGNFYRMATKYPCQAKKQNLVTNENQETTTNSEV